jgi:hypothetical protein
MNIKTLYTKTVLIIRMVLWAGIIAAQSSTGTGTGGESLWIRPNVTNYFKPRWGFKDGIRIGLTPQVIRGLITVYTPYAGQKPDEVLNFFAVEPVPEGETNRGLSELEKSNLDNKRGKRIWTSNDDRAFEPKDENEAATGVVGKENGIETLTVYFFVETFHNRSKVYLKARFYANNPYEVELTSYKQKDSKELNYCIVTATMGNYARLRNLYLKDKMRSSKDIWPDYEEHDFAPHEMIDRKQMVTGKNDCPYFIAAPDEANPQVAEYETGTANHWKYIGKPATQYWYCKDADDSLQGLVNGRVVYWGSHHRIPGGITFENFEMKKRFRNGDRFVFGVSPLAPVDFMKTIR